MSERLIAVIIPISSESVDPDGSECAVCGDAIYLAQTSIVAKIGTADHPVAQLCGSCVEAFRGECPWL